MLIWGDFLAGCCLSNTLPIPSAYRPPSFLVSLPDGTEHAAAFEQISVVQGPSLTAQRPPEAPASSIQHSAVVPDASHLSQAYQPPAPPQRAELHAAPRPPAPPPVPAPFVPAPPAASTKPSIQAIMEVCGGGLGLDRAGWGELFGGHGMHDSRGARLGGD